MVKKQQIDSFIEMDYKLSLTKKYTEEEIRELASLAEAANKEIWQNVVEYTFRNFGKFSYDFLIEVKENCIKELAKKHSKQEAAKQTDLLMISYLFTSYINNIFTRRGIAEQAQFLKAYKAGKFDQFINFDSLNIIV